ncbi:MAG: glycosyltransferase family 4 protein [Nitrospirae bacterium]|nr:glycosyltransferase family 4 protein [Nitrospirota bacterium]
MPNIKIIRIIARLNIGGPAIHTILLSSELDKLGYKTILVKGTEGPREGSMTDLAESKGIKPVVIPELGREIGLKNDLIAFYKLYKLIKKEKPDIVHTHTAKAGTLGRQAAWLARVPVIIHTFHGHVLTGYFGKLKSWIFIQMEKGLANISTRIITLSEELKRELMGMGIGSAEKFETIPLGLKLAPFFDLAKYRGEFRTEIGVSLDTLLIGIVGRLVPIKGHRQFLEGAKIITDRMKHAGVTFYEDLLKKATDVKFVIVGDGELREELEEYAKKLGIADKVIFTGFRRDLQRIYADLDIVALTSFNEGTPVSIIEAMVGDKPVVAANVGGVSSLVKDGVTGFLVPPGRADLFADALIKLLSDALLRKKMGEAGRRCVFPKYDSSNLVKTMDELYSSLVKKSPALTADKS